MTKKSGTNSKSLKNNDLGSNSPDLGAAAIKRQMPLFHIEKHAEVNSIEMGVLDSGIPYLTGRGLERMCGLGHGPFHRLISNWAEEVEIKPLLMGMVLLQRMKLSNGLGLVLINI